MVVTVAVEQIEYREFRHERTVSVHEGQIGRLGQHYREVLVKVQNIAPVSEF